MESRGRASAVQSKHSMDAGQKWAQMGMVNLGAQPTGPGVQVWCLVSLRCVRNSGISKHKSPRGLAGFQI